MKITVNFTRLFWRGIAAVFMLLGVIGIFMAAMWLANLYDANISYPLQAVVERNGIFLPIAYMAIGWLSFMLFREFFRQEHDARLNLRAQTRLGKIAQAAKDNW